MSTEEFPRVWGYMVSKLGMNAANQDEARETYEVLCQIAPSISKIIPVAAGWVSRVMTVSGHNPGYVADMVQLKALYQVELFARGCELVSLVIEQERKKQQEADN